MGQRLNLEVIQGEKVIANAYYHWSAYTETALALVKEMVHHLELSKEQKSYNSSPDVVLRRVVSAFHKTDAKLTQEELAYIQSSELDDSTKRVFTHQVASYTRAVDRSDGLISISPEDIASTRQNAEYAAIIDYDTLTVQFGVIDYYENMEELQDSYDLDEDDAEAVPLYEKDIETGAMNSTQIAELEDALELAKQHPFTCFKTPDGSHYSCIE